MKSEDCLIVHFGMEGEVEMAFFFFFFLIFSFHELRGLNKSCCFGGIQMGSFCFGTFRHLHRFGSGWFGFLLQCGVLLCKHIKKKTTSSMVLPGTGGWDSSFAEQALPCCYFLHLYYFLSITNRGKSLKQLRAPCGHPGLGWDGFLCTTRWSKKEKQTNKPTRPVQLR